MAKAKGKKVARAASTGGGRTSRGNTPWNWYLVMAVVVVLGVAGVVQSRADHQQRFKPIAQTEPPRPSDPGSGFAGDHWHAAYGVFVCDTYMPPITDQNDPRGIHTHGDGLIHIHPNSRAAAGDNATLGQFLSAIRMTVTTTKLEALGDKTYENGDKCGDKAGKVQVLAGTGPTDLKPVKGDPGKLRFEENQVIVLAFAPEGTEFPPVPSLSELAAPSDVAPQTPPGGAPPGGELPPGTELPPGVELPPGAEAPPGAGAPPGAEAPPGETPPPAPAP